MTLDTLTRATAERKHAQLKSSLAQARSEFRERFKHETELFRSLPAAGSITAAIPLSPIVHPAARGTSETSNTTGGGSLLVASPVSLSSPQLQQQLQGEDLVRSERLSQCCKRVRVWRRQTTNPLLTYKQQQLTKVQGSTGNGSNGSGGPPGKIAGSTSASDHRMHLSLLMAVIVDMYEQKMAVEVGTSTVLLPTSGGSLSESFPEFVIKYISARSTSRRLAVDQINGTVSLLLQPSSHARIRTCAALCGLDDKYNPPEKLRAFLHMIESVHRLKASSVATTPMAFKPEDASSLAEVVFYNLGVPFTVAQAVVTELFSEEYYWNFRFWHSHFRELKLEYAWPRAARAELEDKMLALTMVTRIAALNAAKKIDCDAFLELLLDTWTQRAKVLADLLETTTDDEERKSVASIATKQAAQDARGQIAPLTQEELQLFEELVEEFWNAEVPWSTSNKIQRRVSAACRGERSISEVALLYRKHVAELDDSKKVWLWQQWPWEVDWEWGLLVVRDDQLATS